MKLQDKIFRLLISLFGFEIFIFVQKERFKRWYKLVWPIWTRNLHSRTVGILLFWGFMSIEFTFPAKPKVSSNLGLGGGFNNSEE